MNLRTIQKAVVLFVMLVSMMMPAKMGVGQGTNGSLTFNSPTSLLFPEAMFRHSNGLVYIGLDDGIQVFTNTGTFVRSFSSHGNAYDQISGTHGIGELTNGNIIVTDLWNNRLQIFTPDGVHVQTVAETQFQYVPQGLAVTKSHNVVVVDHIGRAIVFSESGTKLSEFPIPFGSCGIATDTSGLLYVVDRYSRRICVYDELGNFKSSIGPFIAELDGIAISSSDILAVTLDGVVSAVSLIDLKTGNQDLITDASWFDGYPRSVAFDSDGSLLVGISRVVPGRPDIPLPGMALKYFKYPPPTSTFSPSPTTTWSNTDITATITSIDNTGGSGVKEIHYSINMGSEQIVASSIASFTLTDNGTHSISYFAVDNAGNTETAKLATVKIDKIAPVTTLSQNGGLIALSATDAHSGIARVKYQINDGAVVDYSVPFADTVHKVTYWAEDVAGNIEVAKTDIINAGVQSVAVSQNRIPGGIGVVGTVTLDKAAGVGGTVINLASSLPGVAFVDPTVTVPEGATSATFDIDANPVAIDTSVSITASIYETSQSALITVQAPTPSSVIWSVSPVTGGTSTVGTVSISGPAPTGGTTVTLASSSLSAIVGSSVTIPAGAMTATFAVSTNAVSNDTSAVISATVYGAKLKTTLSILGPKVTSVTMAASSVVSLGTTTGTVTLSTNAPVGGKVVTLSSSNAVVASVPVSVTVAAGTKTATFTVTAGSVNASSTATITAATNGSTGTATLTVTPPPAAISGITTNVAAVTGGLAVTGTVTLTNPAPTGGAVIALASTPSTAGTVPASVTVAAGATTATFTITTKAVTAATTLTVTGSYLGVAKVATITVNPARVVSTLTLNPTTVKGGTNSTGTITLTGIATENVVVSLTSGTTTVATVPTSVTVLAGSSTATFTITTLAQTATRTSIITARTGTTSRTATLSVTR